MLDAFDLLLHLSRELLLLAYRCLPDLSKMEIHVQLELLYSLLLALQLSLAALNFAHISMYRSLLF